MNNMKTLIEKLESAKVNKLSKPELLELFIEWEQTINLHYYEIQKLNNYMDFFINFDKEILSI